MIDLSIQVLELPSITLLPVLELSELLYLGNPLPFLPPQTMVSYSLTELELWLTFRKVRNLKLDSHRLKRLKLQDHLVQSPFQQ